MSQENVEIVRETNDRAGAPTIDDQSRRRRTIRGGRVVQLVGYEDVSEALRAIGLKE